MQRLRVLAGHARAGRRACAAAAAAGAKPPVLLTQDGMVAVVTLNAPPMNLFSIDTVNALEALFPKLDADAGVRAVVIRGGPDHFSGGANLKQIMAGKAAGAVPPGFVYRGKEVPQNEAFIRQRMALVNTVEAMRKPVVASIIGACVGGGLELSLGCTFRIAARGCKIGLPEINRGFPPAWGGTVRLTKTVGRARALEMALRGRLLDADEAASIGLVHEAVEPADLERRTLELAHELAEKAPLAVAGVMEAILVGGDMPTLEGVEVEYRAQRRSAGSEDAQEGIRAFFEKRKAVFKGR